MRLYRAETFFHWAGAVDALLAIRLKRDFHSERTKIKFRRMHLYGELSERQQAYSLIRTKQKLDEWFKYHWHTKSAGKEDVERILGDQ